MNKARSLPYVRLRSGCIAAELLAVARCAASGERRRALFYRHAILDCMRPLVVVALFVSLVSPAFGQSRRPPARRAAPKPPPLKIEPAMLNCPSALGSGITTRRSYCDVLTGRTAAEGVTIDLPPHTGPVTLTFDLHNRHTYSEELVKANRGFRRYTATIGVLTADNTLLTRAIIQNEFRTAQDLVERIGGGAGPGGVKAVAPTGIESITVSIPEEEESVSIVGEKLSVLRIDGIDNFYAAGRPIAVISNVMLEYRPKPTPAARRRR